MSRSPNTSAAGPDAPAAAVALRTTIAATSTTDMPTVAVPLGAVSAGTALPAASERIARRRRLQWKNPLKQLVRKSIIGVFGVWLKLSTNLVKHLNSVSAGTALPAASERIARRRRLQWKNPLKQLVRKSIIGVFGVWLKLSTNLVKHLNWFPSVKPSVGYGTEESSRLVCRTIYAPTRAKPHTPMRGIQAMLEVPAAHERVSIHIDGVPLRTVQVGTMEVYDRNDPARAQTMAYSVSDSAGYLDLLAEHRLQPGVHRFSCKVPRRGPVEAELFTIPSDAKVGVISDVDDTIMVTQVPTLWKAAYNMLLLSPRKREPRAASQLVPERQTVCGLWQRGIFAPRMPHDLRADARQTAYANARHPRDARGAVGSRACEHPHRRRAAAHCAGGHDGGV